VKLTRGPVFTVPDCAAQPPVVTLGDDRFAGVDAAAAGGIPLVVVVAHQGAPVPTQSARHRVDSLHSLSGELAQWNDTVQCRRGWGVRMEGVS
jgi:hypothetical protein